VRKYSSGFDWRSVKNFSLEEAHSGHINSTFPVLGEDKKKESKVRYFDIRPVEDDFSWKL
jgi:hypothetical protein